MKDFELPKRVVSEEDGEVDVAQGTPARPTVATPFGEIMTRRLERRSFLKGGAAAALMVVAPAAYFGGLKTAEARGRPDFAGRLRGRGRPSGLTFEPIAGSDADDVIVPNGYRADVLIRWGDSLDPAVPDLDTSNLGQLLVPGAAVRQERQFGYNCDFNGYFPLPFPRSRNPNRGLLVVNHEFTTDELMFPGWPDDDAALAAFVDANPEVVRVAKAAHGVAVVEIVRGRDEDEDEDERGLWTYRRDSRFNRRVTGDTPMMLTGPAAGDALLRTAAESTGTRVNGMLNNCAGGKTPWGTVLTCEENFDQYFGNFDGLAALADSTGDADLQKAVDFHRRIPVPGGLSRRGWERVDARFDVEKNPNEAFRFGWVVEIDPYDPDSTPKKRTALGRFKHEGATTAVAPGGQVVVYSGDDARFEYVYKFVSAGRFNPHGRRRANADLLDDGTLYVAKFNEDGSGRWLPLVFGEGPLTPANGFNSQAEVLINARRAGDVLGATPMDRPEDIEPSPETGKVYVALTNNSRRTGGTRDANGREVSAEPDDMNPRSPNLTGHIIEVTEAGGDAAATSFSWEIFILCGNPNNPDGQLLYTLPEAPVGVDDTYFAGFADASALSPIGSPDNVAFDRRGNLWIATDGQFGDLDLPSPINDGLYAVPTEGEDRGFLRQFLSSVRGSEVCGPEFNPNFTTVFINVQHPGEGGTLDNPVSDWPDRNGLPPRPSVVAVIKTEGSPIIGSGVGDDEGGEDDEDEEDEDRGRGRGRRGEED